MTFEGGQTGFLLGLDEARFTAFEMDVIGTAGRLRITDSGRRFEWSTVADSSNYSGYRSLRPGEIVQRGFQDAAACLVDNVVAALESGAALKCSARDGLAALAACDAARRSLLSGEECRVT
jgi:predicted dehydrogenase